MQKKAKLRSDQPPLFVPESTVDSERTEKNIDEFIAVASRYRSSVWDSK